MDILGRFYRSKVQLDFTFTTPKIMIGIQSGGDPMNVRLACFAAAMLTVTFSTVSFLKERENNAVRARTMLFGFAAIQFRTSLA
jgi:hypothetical protein